MSKADSTLSPAKIAKNGVVLSIRLTPNARADEIGSVEADVDGGAVLKVKVRAIPEKGKANKALIVLLSKWLSIPKSRIEIVSGAGSRLKQVLLEGDPEVILETVRTRLSSA